MEQNLKYWRSVLMDSKAASYPVVQIVIANGVNVQSDADNGQTGQGRDDRNLELQPSMTLSYKFARGQMALWRR
jgi:hypothetical protein